MSVKRKSNVENINIFFRDLNLFLQFKKVVTKFRKVIGMKITPTKHILSAHKAIEYTLVDVIREEIKHQDPIEKEYNAKLMFN